MPFLFSRTSIGIMVINQTPNSHTHKSVHSSIVAVKTQTLKRFKLRDRKNYKFRILTSLSSERAAPTPEQDCA